MAYESETSMGALLRGALDDMRELIREEILLARTEVRQEAAKLSAAGVQFGIAGAALWFAGMFLLVALALGMAALFDWPAWAAFGSIAIVLAIAGVVALSAGRRALKAVAPLPRTVTTIKETLK